MEKKIGIVAIQINDGKQASQVNSLLSEYGEIILSRQGLNIISEKVHVISLIVHGEANIVNALTGRMGRLKDVKVRTLQLS